MSGWLRSHRQELLAGSVAGLLSFAVYLWTAAPNVTLLDSGEFIVAAQHFGVPHPTGYPLWTLLAWLFQLLPLGNAAWEINLFSGVCGALAVAMCAGMLTSLLGWFLEGRLTGRLGLLPPIMGVSSALLLAFSVSMWSQAVIAEVYTLHALAVSVYLALLYGWARNPSKDRLMLFAFFVLALSFSNHHLTLTLTPLPFLLILLLRRRALGDWLLAGAVTLLLGYLGFAILSADLAVLKTAIRLFWVVAAGGVVFVACRRLRVRWKLVAFLPLAVGAGLLPYAYMPLASSTNPPMNWAYARDPRGFFYSINRSQYGGSLSDQSLKVLGPLLGTSGLPDTGDKPLRPRTRFDPTSGLEAAQLWVGFFWSQLVAAFTPFSIIGYFASIFFILRAPLPQRTWIYLLHFAFVLAAFLQPVMDKAEIDVSGWWLQMPYHTYTNLIYAMLSGLGLGLLIAKLYRRRALYFWLAPATLLLPVFTALESEPVASQRGRWFGWMFGRDMLADLPPNSVMIGGTDPGRFVPTYMIFGESPQAARHKRDPSFDRRDLYIITQNALGEEFYMKYLRDHYGPDRPRPRNAFERWLGREHTYPEKPLVLPTDDEVREAIEAASQPDPETGKALEEDPTLIPFSAVFKWIWERNRDEHDFFVEESFSLPWTYDYAEPHGLCYRMHKSKLDRLPEGSVERDFAFWESYMAKLFSDPEFRQDLDARRAFSKLRITGANIYKHWKLNEEAERAYRQALELWPASPEALVGLVQLMWDDGRNKESLEILDRAFREDPNNRLILHLAVMAQRREELAGEVEALDSKARGGDSSALAKLFGAFTALDDTNRAKKLVADLLENPPDDTDSLRVLVNYTGIENLPAQHLRATELLVNAAPEDPHAQFLHARALMLDGNEDAAAEAARRAVELGGRRFREELRIDPAFAPARTNAAFRELLAPFAPPPG